MAKNNKTKKQAADGTLWERIRKPASNLWQGFIRSRRLVGVVVLFLLVCAAMFSPFFSGIPLRPGDRAAHTVFVTKTTTFEDTDATETARREARDNVQKVYLTDPLIADVGDVMDHVSDVREGGLFDRPRGADPVKQELIEYMFLSPNTIDVLLDRDTAGLTRLFSHTVSLIKKLAGNRDWMNEADLDRLPELVAARVDKGELSETEAAVVRDIITSLAVRSYDSDETERRRTAAAAAIEPVMRTQEKSVPLVKKGETLTKAHLDVMAKQGRKPRRMLIGHIAGGALILLFAFVLTGAYLVYFDRETLEDDKKIFIFYVLVLLSVLGALLIYLLSESMPGFSAYTLGISTGVLAILTCFLVRPALALVAAPLLAAVCAIIMKFHIGVFFTALVSGLLGYYYSLRRQDMENIMKAGLAIAAGSMCVIAALTLIRFTSLKQALLDIFLFGALNGLITSVLATGMLPLFERAFNIITPHRLLELSNPEHPLLKNLLINAPGTYHHCIFVGNLAETAAEAVGADPLLVRIAAYYHDVGKLKRPYFFTENQITGENQLAEVTPTLGSLVISSHVKDGVEMLREHKIPPGIIRIASEHHGTGLISFFYQQARARAKDPDTVTEERFRYPGPVPSTLESAILMMCDGCEAAVRSLKEPSARNIENTVNNIVKARLMDGQFDKCDITLQQIDTVRRMLIETLARIYHARIEYPDEEELKLKIHGPERNGKAEDKTSA